MAKAIKELIIMFLFTSVKSQKSLENFIKKKTIEKSTITILNVPNNETNYTWIEYQYEFDNNNDINLKSYSDRETNDTLVEAPQETSLIVYFNTENCQKTHGNTYTDYLQSVLEIIVANTDVEVIHTNDTQLNDDPDLITCNNGLEGVGLRDYRPLNAILTSKYALVYKKQHKAQDIFVLTFVGILWLCFLAILLLLAICLSISTYYYSKIYLERRWSWVEITLWAIAAACQQGLSYTPTRIISQFFFLLGYINAYVLYTAFTAAITSILVQQETAGINIKEFNIIGYTGTTSDRLSFGGYKIASHSNNLTQVFDKVNQGANIGFAAEVFINRYFDKENINTNAYKVIALDKALGVHQESLLIRKSFPYQENAINQKLIRMFESGILKQIKRKTLKSAQHENTTQGYSNASLEHVKSAILLFLIGLGLALVFLIIELAVFGYRHR